MANKTRLKIIEILEKEGKVHKFSMEEVDTGALVELKVFENKQFINELVVGEIGYGLVNENWINSWDKFNAQDPVPTSPPTPKPTQTTKTAPNGARTGMLVNNAIQVELHNAKIENRLVNLKNVDGVIIALDAIVKKNE